MTARLEGLHIPTPPEGYYWKVGWATPIKILLMKKRTYRPDLEVGGFFSNRVFCQEDLEREANRVLWNIDYENSEERYHWYLLTVYANSRKEA